SGHRVTLAEAASALGGLVNTARQYPKIKNLHDIVLWQEAEVYRLGVTVKLSTYMENDDIAAENPDVVIVATGAEPHMDKPILQAAGPSPAVRVGEGARILDALTLLESRNRDIGKTALVLDDLGHYEAIACAE